MSYFDDNWNPMEEDYRSTMAAKQNFTDELDNLCLYVKNIPISVTKDQFTRIMSANGRREVSYIMLNTRNANYNQTTTFGFARFVYHKEAQHALHELNGTPPYHLQISYANKKSHNGEQFNTSGGRGKSVSFGRGRRIDLDGATSIFNSGDRRVPSQERGNISSAPVEKSSFSNSSKGKGPFASKGRGVPVIKDGDKEPIQIIAGCSGRKVFLLHTSSTHKESNEKPIVSSTLVPNPFLTCFVCQKDAQLSCQYCNKPYCSGSCQSNDKYHQHICKKAEKIAVTLIQMYKNSEIQNDSSYMSENSNSDHEKSEVTSSNTIDIVKGTQIEKLHVSEGKVEKVSVVHSDNPSRFWIRLEKFASGFKEMERKLSEHHFLPFAPQALIVQDLNCCTLCNGKMCRVEVKKIKSENEILIFLVDYGKTFTVQKQALCPLPTEFRHLPAQAVCCMLVDETMKENVQWTEDDSLSFQLHTSDKIYKAFFYRCINDIHEVSLTYDGNTLYTILTEEKNTSSCVTESQNYPPITNIPVSRRRAVPKSAIDFHEKTAEIKVITSKVLSVDKKYAEKSTEKKVIASKVLSLDKKYNVKVAFMNTPSELYVHLSTDGKEMQEMADNLNYFCKARSGSYAPSIGEMVSCKFSDSLWYRGEVKEKLNDDRYNISFVDYGNVDAVHQKDIQALPEKFISPKYAVCISLSGIKKEDLSQHLLNNLFRENWEMKIVNDKKVPIEVMLFLNGHSLHDIVQQEASKKSNMHYLTFKKLPEEETVDVKICHVDEKYVYLHQIIDLNIVKELVNKLNSPLEMPTVANPVINNIYCGLFTDDGLWYRVVVKEKICNLYRVYFLDFGNYGNVPAQNLREIPEDLLAVPVVCVPTVTENREELVIDFEKQFSVQVTGMQGKVQKIKFVLEQKDCSAMNINKSKTLVESSLKFEKLSNEKAVAVKICHSDEKYVYFQQVKDLKVIDELTDKLNKSSKLQAVSNPVINNVYCGKFTDGILYRVVVKEKLSNSCKVFFLDYGNYDNLTIDNLWELPEDFWEIPVVCVPTVAENREEVTLNHEEEYTIKVTGMQGSIQIIQFILEQKDCSTMNITQIKPVNESLLKYQKLSTEGTVDVKICYADEEYIYLQQVKDLKVIDELSLKLNSLSELPAVANPVINNVYCGLFTDGSWYRILVKEKVSNLYRIYFLDYGNYDNISADNLRELPVSFFEVPVLCVPVVVENREGLVIDPEKNYVVKVNQLQGEHQQVAFLNEEENSKLPHISSMKKQHLQDGLNEVIFSFYEGDIGYCQLSSDSDCIVEMFKKLQRCGKEVPSSVSVGDVICAQSSDGFWYRASVISNKKAPSYKVFFLDYGNSEFVTGDCIKILPGDLLDLPALAISVKIDNRENLKDMSNLNGPVSIKKIKLLDDNVYIVEIIEEDTDLPKISSFKNEILPSGSVLNVTICYMEDNIFYIHPFSHKDKLSKLVNELLKADTFDTLPRVPKINDVVCAKSSDDSTWYRCAVQEVYTDKIKVSFIDYGNSETLNLENIKILPSELCTYPILSVPVLFSNLEAVKEKLKANIDTLDVTVSGLKDSIQVVDIFSETDTKNSVMLEEPVSRTRVFFSDIGRQELPINEKRNVIFVFKDNDKLFLQDLADENITQVRNVLSECSSFSNISDKPAVGELVCTMSQVDNLYYRGCIEEVVSDCDYKIFFIDYGNCETVSMKNLKPFPKTLTKYPSFGIPVKFASEKISESIQLEQAYTVVAETKSSNNEQIIKIVNDENELNYKNNVEPLVHEEVAFSKNVKTFTYTSLKSVPFNSGEQDIVIYYVNDQGYIFCAPLNKKNISDNLEFPSILTKHCENKGVPFDKDCGPDQGEMVLAQYPEDNNWYRAAVMDKSSSNYDVYFVDFGNTETLDLSLLRKMEPQFMEMDIQAHMCSLTGFTVSDENLPKVYEELKNFTCFNSEPLKANVLVIGEDITANVPKITSLLLEKNLVTAIDPN